MKVDYALYGRGKPHSRIVAYLLYLGLVYVNQGNLKELKSMEQQSLQVKRPINEHDNAYPEIEESLSNIALSYNGRG